jgi:pantetheine-phosphate adenylyltransferase, bacterial
MTIAICPGSFDPVTNGHYDVISRSAKIFDKVIVCILINPSKQPMFTAEERVRFVEKVTANLPNVEVDTFTGLLVDYAREKGAKAIVKGLRAVSDFEYEFQQALTNKVLNPDLETVYLNTSAEYMYLSSSIVKQVGAFGGDISAFIPAEVVEEVEKAVHERSKI